MRAPTGTRLLFRNIVGARIARPLLEFVQNLEFAHLLPYIEKIFLFVKFWRVSFVLSIGRWMDDVALYGR